MKCAYHPTREPIGACVECGRFICVECKALLGGKLYCTPCADKLFVNQGREPIAKPIIIPNTEPTPKRVAANTAQQPKNSGQSPVKVNQQTSQKPAQIPEVKKPQTEDEATMLKRAKAKTYASRFWRGLIGLAVGITITVVTYSYDVIPVAVTAYGIILLGAWWFISGLFGWLNNRV